MVFASMLVVCTMATCNDYGADVAMFKDDGNTNTVNVQKELDTAMQTEEGMNKFLKKYHIGETVFEIVSIDVENRTLYEDQIP